MEYKKIIKDNYTLHLVKTDRFKSMNIVIFFTKKFDKDDLKYARLLASNLVYTSKKYNTKNAIAIKGEDLYGTRVSTSFDIVGNTEQFVISCDFLNPKYTKDCLLDESIDFLCEILFNPNVNDDGFNEEYFNVIKKDLISSINSIKDNPNAYSNIEYNKIMYKGTPSENTSLPTLEMINSVTPKSLYSFYKKLINNTFNIDFFVYGEYDERIVDIIDKKFIKLIGKKDNIKFSIDHKYNNNLIEKVDSLNYNQSKLYIGYRLNNLDYHELYHVMKVYNTILGTMNDSILFNIVREEYSLCYSIGSYYSKYNPSLTIYAGINKNNYEKSVELIKKCVDLMKDKKILSRLFDSAKKTINTYINDYYDDCTSQINKFYSDNYEYGEDIETYREKINDVTIDEVIKLNDKITLSTIYLLKGDKNDKENI